MGRWDQNLTVHTWYNVSYPVGRAGVTSCYVGEQGDETGGGDGRSRRVGEFGSTSDQITAQYASQMLDP